jgi:hypothetical protein
LIKKFQCAPAACAGQKSPNTNFNVLSGKTGRFRKILVKLCQVEGLIVVQMSTVLSYLRVKQKNGRDCFVFKYRDLKRFISVQRTITDKIMDQMIVAMQYGSRG